MPVIVAREVCMTGSVCSIPRIFHSGLIGLAVMCGSVAGHGQPAPQPSVPPAATAPAGSVAAPAAVAPSMPPAGAPVEPNDIAAQSAPTPAPPPTEMTSAELPRDLTPLGMFM